jgi:hypothetical protein
MSSIRDKYTFVENKDKKWQCIGLTANAGKYQGIVYQYGEVKVLENEEKTEASLQFDFDVIDSNGLPEEMLDDDLYELMGDILTDIIEQQIDRDTLQYVNPDD